MRTLVMTRWPQLAALALVGLLAGCGNDNPTKPPANQTPQYPTPNSPQNALDAMIKAYANRDSVEYRKLYDFNYTGVSQDLRYGTILNLTWSDESAHIRALARANTITSIDFSIGTPSSWTRQPSDDLGHPEWALIQISGSQFRLEINDNNLGTLLVNNSSNTYTFRFKPTPPDSTSTDTLWTIVQWSEVANP